MNDENVKEKRIMYYVYRTKHWQNNSNGWWQTWTSPLAFIVVLATLIHYWLSEDASNGERIAV